MNSLMVNNFSLVEHKAEPYIAGTEITRRLGYENPHIQASQIWKKNKEFLEANSTVFKLKTLDGRLRDVRCYSEAGAKELLKSLAINIKPVLCQVN